MSILDSDDQTGLALAALTLTTAVLATQVRAGSLSIEALRAIVRDAHMLANDVAGFVVDEKSAEMAADFLSMAEALAMPDAPRVPARALRLASMSAGKPPEHTTKSILGVAAVAADIGTGQYGKDRAPAETTLRDPPFPRLGHV